MTELVMINLIESSTETRLKDRAGRREEPKARGRGAGDTAATEFDEFRAELACGCPQPGSEREPYEEGFGAHEGGVGLLDNPYNGDNCAHQQWANGWSQARDEAQRRARQFPR